jgi:PAS domain S-box-containing protein
MVPLRKEEKVKLILDLAIVLITSILIFSIVFFDILIDLSENNPTIFPNLFKIITAFAFPVLDIILIWSFLYFLYRRKATNRKWVLGMLLAGVISLAISDYMTNYELIKNSYINGNISDYGGFLAFLLFALAGNRQKNVLTENNPNRPVYENIKLLKLPKKIISFIPLVWSLLSYFTLIWLYENRHTNSIQFVIGGVVVIIVLTFIRQVVTLRENHKLTNELENEVENIKKELSEDYAFQNELLTDLAQSENKYRNLIENSLQGVLIFTNNNIVFANKRIEVILGYTADELIAFKSDEYEKLFPEEGLRFLINNIKEHSASKDKPFVYQTKFIHKNGEIIWLELISSIITYNNELCIQIAFIDITERKIAEEELSRNEEKYRALFENNLDCIFIFDTDSNKILDFNSAALKLYGYDYDELIGQNILILSTAIDQSQKAIQELKENGHARIIHRNHKRKDGTIFPVESMMITYDLRGKKVACAMIHNISERIEIEEKKKEITNELIEINKSKDKFFSIIAHDLKSPFQGLLGFSELLDEDYYKLSDEDKKRFIENIRSTSKILYNLVENLLLWSRIQTGRIQFDPDKINIFVLVKRNIDILKANIHNKKLYLENNISNNIELTADEMMIQQVIQNLLSNAIKFTPSGGKIKLFDERTNGVYKFSIEDTGIGIPEEKIPELFKIDSNYSTNGTDNENGTGLGLILCKEFVERHGGKIIVESKVGKGSKFTVVLPANN